MVGYTLALYLAGSMIATSTYHSPTDCAKAAIEYSISLKEHEGRAVCTDDATGNVVFDTNLI
jgi:hypothetical protein